MLQRGELKEYHVQVDEMKYKVSVKLHRVATEQNRRKFMFCHPRGYKGYRLIIGFYETYCKGD